MRAVPILTGLLALPALGQDGAARLFETTVRSGPRQAPGQTAVGPESVKDTGAQSAIDAAEWDVALTSSTGARGERIFTLRGFDQRQVAVLLDGAPFLLPYDGQLDLGMVPAALVERIEVVKGPGSVTIGLNGLGGAVNIVTRTGDDGALFRAWAETSPTLGTEVRLAHSLKLGRVAWTVAAGSLGQSAWPLSAAFIPTAYEPGPLRRNSDKRLSHVALSTKVTLTPRQSLVLSAWFFDGERGMPPSTVDDRPRYWRFSVWRALNVQLGHQVALSENAAIDTLGWVRNFDNLVDSYDDARYLTQDKARAFSSWYHDPVAGVRSRAQVRLQAPWGPVHLRLWAGGAWEAHHATTSNAPDDDYSRVTATLAPEVETTFARKLTLQLALQGDLEVPLQVASVVPGTSLNPRLTAQWRPINGLSLGVTGARTSRFPTLRERFSAAMGFREPNPALGPESAWSLSGECRWSPFEGLQLLAFGSHSAVQGLIAEVRIPGGLTQLQNVAHAQLSSGEVTLGLEPLRGLRLEVGAQVLRAVQWTDAGAIPLDYRATWAGRAELRLQPVRQLFVWAGVRASSARPFLNPDTRKQDTLPGFADVSLRTEYRPTPGVAAWARVTNLLNAAADSQFGFPRQGRQLFVGLSLEIDRPLTEGEPP